MTGLCLNPPNNATAQCVDGKSQIQVPDRTQPALPLGLGHVDGCTRDCARHGATTLFAAVSQRAIRQGSFDSVSRLVRTIENFIADCNETASPSVWVATADSIVGKLESLSKRICGTEH